MTGIIRRIGLLSTGDELVNGDVLNTNSRKIACRLMEHQIQPGMHATANDDQTQIEKAMRFLLAEHDAMIITGGLGPTSDDRTRFALSAVLNKPLVFDETSWQRITARLQRLSLPVSENNRQQALFPSGAEIFPNDNGTASGCLIYAEQKPIFMLPGPPFECFPIFEEKVLPHLLEKHFAQRYFRCEWLLLPGIESQIAAQLDPLMENSNCCVGYRVHSPYLDVKLFSLDSNSLEKMRKIFDKIIGTKSISTKKQTASEQLREYIFKSKTLISIDDQATGGRIELALLAPETSAYLRFTDHVERYHSTHIIISGIANYWANQPESGPLNIEIITNQESQQSILTIPFRKDRTPMYATEMACWEILCQLKSP